MSKPKGTTTGTANMWCFAAVLSLRCDARVERCLPGSKGTTNVSAGVGFGDRVSGTVAPRRYG